MTVHGYQIFHLNLGFSSIPSERRSDVIKKCYWPMLNYATTADVPIGVELSGWTLEQINIIDPEWIERFRQMLSARQCELIGSGWAQIIGPLVPYNVNDWNQRLGIKTYNQLLGVRPTIALINEMAFSSSMVDLYAEAGYQAIIIDRDNVRLTLGLNNEPLAATPTHARGCGNTALPILWADSILLQRLQRVVHGDIPLSEYMSYLKLRITNNETVLPIYCNDVEIFDFRPGRFTVESPLHQEGEWDRLSRISNEIKRSFAIKWISPCTAISTLLTDRHPHYAKLTSAGQPIPVKKQAKYNVVRWAASGRDDLWLNTSCHRIYQSLLSCAEKTEESWKNLCSLWASDLRTHITDVRWEEATALIESMTSRIPTPPRFENGNEPSSDEFGSLANIDKDEEGIFLRVTTERIQITLNIRRGLTVKSLAFKSQSFKPILVTLPQGFFSSIELGADFYTGGIQIEIPGERTRLTDLDWVEPQIFRKADELIIRADISLNHKKLKKTIAVNLFDERVRFGYDFGTWGRPVGTVRTGFLTLNPEVFELPLSLECSNGGLTPEKFLVEQDINHGRAVSTLVSSSAAFGATDGKFNVLSSNGLCFSSVWEPSECAVVPMFQHQQAGNHFLSRLFFSMCEIDETLRPGGRLLPFNFAIQPS